MSFWVHFEVFDLTTSQISEYGLGEDDDQQIEDGMRPELHK